MGLFVLALIILVAIFGFWDTLGAILGGVAIVFVLLAAAIGFAAWTGYKAFAARRP